MSGESTPEKMIETLRESVFEIVRIEFEEADDVETGIQHVEDDGDVWAVTNPEDLQREITGYIEDRNIMFRRKSGGRGWKQPRLDVLVESDDGERSWHEFRVTGVEVVSDE